MREVDQVRVKGKKETTRIFELLDEPSKDLIDMIAIFGEALQVYREGRFALAKARFERCRSLFPSDGPSRLFIERCVKYIQEAPHDWDGVTTFYEK